MDSDVRRALSSRVRHRCSDRSPTARVPSTATVPTAVSGLVVAASASAGGALLVLTLDHGPHGGIASVFVGQAELTTTPRTSFAARRVHTALGSAIRPALVSHPSQPLPLVRQHELA